MRLVNLRDNINLSSQHFAGGLTWQCEKLTFEILKGLEKDWNNLYLSASEENYFFDHHYIINSLPLLNKYKPKILTIWDDKELIGLIILRTDIGYGKLPLPFWRPALHFEQYLGTPIVSAHKEDKFALALCKWLDNAPLHCGFLNLAMLSCDSDISKAIQKHCNQEGRLFFRVNSFKRAAIMPSQHNGLDPEKLMSTSRRKNIRKSMDRLSQLGNIRIERLSKESDLISWIDHFFALEDTGWKHENGSSILSCAYEAALYREIIKAAFHRKNLIFTRLCLDGEALAYTLDIASGQHGYCLKSAINHDYRKYSPGIIMEFETLKYYLEQHHYTHLDSCTAPDNHLLNELWPDKIAISDLVIERKGFLFSMIFRAIYAIKSKNNSV